LFPFQEFILDIFVETEGEFLHGKIKGGGVTYANALSAHRFSWLHRQRAWCHSFSVLLSPAWEKWWCYLPLAFN